MSKAPKEYQKLPGRGARVDGGQLFTLTRSFCRVWMGRDHLLVVDRTGYTETYKRLYFRDIQAVIIRKTNRAFVWNCILCPLVLFFLAWALDVQNLPGRVTLWIFTGIFGTLTLVNNILGKSCVTHIKTAVQTEQLPAWKRVRTARKGMEPIRPLILQAQGNVSADELKAQLEERVRRQTQGPAAEVT